MLIMATGTDFGWNTQLVRADYYLSASFTEMHKPSSPIASGMCSLVGDRPAPSFQALKVVIRIVEP